ncbi:MAG: ABC transporter substrate-binding protein [Bacteroidales bacterium]
MIAKKNLPKLAKITGLLSLTLLALACHSSTDKFSPTGTVDSLTNRYALGFRIVQTVDGYLAEVFNPWQQAHNVTIPYYLTRSNRASKPIKSVEIHIPVKKIVCLSSTHIAFVDALNETATICGVSGISNVYNASIIQRWQHDSLFEVGFENNINYEKIIKAAPDVVFAYGIGSEINGYIDKLQQLGIPVILVGEYLEQHPLARTEWLKFFALFFDKLDEANQIFAQIDSMYQLWRNRGSQYAIKPKVMMSLPWNGSWFISGANTYVAQLIADAGGQYLWNDLNNNISLPMDFETVFNRCRNADYWINMGQATSKKDMLNTDKRVALFKPFQNGNLYNNIARVRPQGGNDYWESGTVNPHRILADMVKILHPQEARHDSLYYYKKIN